MSHRRFLLLQCVLLALGSGILWQQRNLIREIRTQLEEAEGKQMPHGFAAVVTNLTLSSNSPSPVTSSASIEVLRWRAEVSRLRADLDALAPQAKAANQEADDWSRVWEGPRPSEHPGFRPFAELEAEGWATPETAYASFQHAMRHQAENPLTPTRMKELFHVPDDFDDPNARYSIDLGPGIQGSFGYRIVNSETVEPGRMKLNIDIENTTGSSFREERILILSDGRWRLKPVRIERLPDLPAVTARERGEGEVRTRSETVFLP